MTPPGVALVDLRANRGVPFEDSTDFLAQDYGSATIRVEIRRYRDAPDPPLVILDNASAGAQGVSCSVATVNGDPVSTVVIRINETTLEALQKSSPIGGDVTFQYALDVTGGGFGKHRRMQGAFILEASANG